MTVYAGTDDTNATFALVGKTASGGVGQAGRTAIIAESTNNSNGQSAMHFRTRKTTNAETIAMTIDGNQYVGIGTQLPAGIHNLAKVLEISGGDGGDLIIGNHASSNIGAGAHIGAIAFKNIDSSSGSTPHYAGIRCEARDTAGNMDLRFYTGIANLEADTPQFCMNDSNLGIGTVSPGALLHTYHATSNTCATFESGDAGAGINLKDTDARSSIEQNGVSLKISSDTGGEKASSDIRMQVDGETKMKIDSTGVTALQNCTDQTFKFQVDESWGVYNTNTGLAPNSTRTWTITNVNYGHGTFRLGGADGNYQRGGCVIEIVGTMWATSQVYYYNEVLKSSSGASVSVSYNTDNIVVTLASSSNWFYYTASFIQGRRNGSVFATITQG